MKPTIGINILGQFVDSDAMVARVQQLQPSAVVVMDNVELAKRLKQVFREMTVIHRTYFDGDDEAHLSMTPQAFLDRFGMDYVSIGLHVQALNEPSGYTNLPALVNWCVELMRLAHVRGVRLTLPNLAVGHPSEESVPSGAWDALLRAFVQYPQHKFAIHEYFRQDATEESHLVGRFEAFTNRCIRLGIPSPQFIVTEYGRDEHGRPEDGWTRQGWTEEQYAERCKAGMEIYQPHGIPTCVYCAGEGYGDDWVTFSIENAHGWYRRIAEYNKGVKEMSEVIYAVPANLAPGMLMRTPATEVNIRSAPKVSEPAAANVIGKASAGAVLYYGEHPATPGWYYVKNTTGTLAGWMSQQDGKVVIKPYTGQETPTVEQEMATLHQQLADTHAKIAQVYRDAK